MRPRTFRLACLGGLLVHGALVVAVSAGAYLGVLPTPLRVPRVDLVMHLGEPPAPESCGGARALRLGRRALASESCAGA